VLPHRALKTETENKSFHPRAPARGIQVVFINKKADYPMDNLLFSKKFIDISIVTEQTVQ